MSGELNSSFPLDEQEIIDMRVEMNTLKDRVADLEQKVGVLLTAAVGIQGGMEALKRGAEQNPDKRWLGDLHLIATDNIP